MRVSKHRLNDIVEAVYLNSYKIQIKFSDGLIKVVDFEPFLTHNKEHPMIKPYLDKETFKVFDVIDSNLNWNDYDLIFHPEELRKGVINKEMLSEACV